MYFGSKAEVLVSGKSPGDDGEIVIGAVPLAQFVELVEIADALVLDQGGDGAAGDRQRARLDLLPFRRDAPIANDEDAADWADAGQRVGGSWR